MVVEQELRSQNYKTRLVSPFRNCTPTPPILVIGIQSRML